MSLEEKEKEACNLMAGILNRVRPDSAMPTLNKIMMLVEKQEVTAVERKEACRLMARMFSLMGDREDIALQKIKSLLREAGHIKK